MGRPNVYPTGTTVYYPDEAYSGYTIYDADGYGVVMVDMNGRVVRYFKNFNGFPPKVLPGGHVIGTRACRPRENGYQDMEDLTMIDMDGNVEWTFNHNQLINDPDGERWMAGQEPDPNFNKMLILTHNDVRKPKISPQLLLEDRLIEIDREGNILWEWNMLDHFNEFGLDETIKNAMFRNPNTQHCGPEGQGDIFHVNCASYLGPNHWFDEGDERFNPENIIMDSREANIMWIISHETGEVVWQVGPDFTKTTELRLFGTIVGPHFTHMIPKGLPGEGNIMLYDNGGWAGYGAPSQTSKTGLKVTRRDGSRVVEFNPTNLEIVWECTGEPLPVAAGFNYNTNYFYSPLTSAAQRMPNGNTVITEGCSGIVREYTADKKLVWEYVAPRGLFLYRAYRIPYEWVPQIEKPEEIEIPRMNVDEFHIGDVDPNNWDEGARDVEGAHAFDTHVAACVTGLDE